MTRPVPAATNCLRQPELPVTPARIAQFPTVRLTTLAKWIGLFASLYLIGPVTFVTRSIQSEASAHVWQADKRWANSVGSALLSLLWYVPVIVFHTALARLWTFVFAVSAASLHLPLISLLGGATLWPPTPMNMLLRWLLALPFASLLACALEMVHPKTRWEAQRVVSEEEALDLAAAKAKLERRRNASRTRRTPPPSTQAVAPTTSPRTQLSIPVGQPSAGTTLSGERRASLWNQVDWSKVPDDDPVKRAALQEAERQVTERRDAEHKRWVANQISAQEQGRQATPSEPAPSGERPVQLPPAPVPPIDYDWDEGEGVVQETL